MPPPPSSAGVRSPPISLPPVQSIPISLSATTTTPTTATKILSPTTPTPTPLPLTVRIFTPSQLLTQLWLPELTRLVNDSYSNPAINSVEYTSDRLKSNRQLVEELGERGFTVVAFDFSLPVGEEERESAGKLVGTASVKNWIDDGLWVPATAPDSQVRDGVSAPCPGDLEVTVVAVRPGIEYRKRGIAERLVCECESEIVRRLKLQDEAHHHQTGSSHVKVMLKVVKEINGLYWSKKGFVVVGQRFCPTGTWDSTRDFTLWAMTRDVSVDS